MIIIRYVLDVIYIETDDGTQLYTECKSNCKVIVDYIQKTIHISNIQNDIIKCSLFDIVDISLTPIINVSDTVSQIETKLKNYGIL